MNSKKWLIGAGVALAAYLLWKKYSLAKNLSFAFQGIAFPKGISNNIEMDFIANNPTTGTATINSVTGNVLVNGSNVASFTSFDQQKIAPLSASPIHVVAKLGLGIINVIFSRNLFTSGANYTINAVINVDGNAIPVTFSGTI
jgi:hypothetical protein